MNQYYEKELIWEHDYGEHNSVIPALREILNTMPPEIVSMIQIIANNNPYNMEFYVAMNLEQATEEHINKIYSLMGTAGSKRRTDITFKDLIDALQERRYNMRSLIDSETLAEDFQEFFFFPERHILAKKMPMHPLSKKAPVFISHSSIDKLAIEKLIPFLNREGLPIWYDKVNIDYGQSIVEAVQEGIVKSKAVLFWITRDFINSSWCKNEMEAFMKMSSF